MKTGEGKLLSVNFSVWADDVDKQIKKQGFLFKDARYRKLYKDFKFSLNLLRLNGMLSDTECQKVCNRIMKKLAKDVMQVK